VSASPSRGGFKPAFNKKAMVEETFVDAVYKNKDPIATSMVSRGNMTNTVPRADGSVPFTFTFAKSGENGPAIESSKRTSVAKSGPGATSRKTNGGGSVGKCPITKSIEERKAAGSVVSIANGVMRIENEIFEFEFAGAKAKIVNDTPTRKSKLN
jgi:hypothetical protein